MSLSIAAAYLAALFFNGTNLEVLSFSLALLIVALAGALWPRRLDSISIPKTGLFVAVLLYCLWLALTLLWNPVKYIGTTFSFWWQSALPIAFIVVSLMAERGQMTWRHLSLFILFGGLGLSMHGIYQIYVLNQPPRSLFLDINMHAAMLNLIALPTAGYLLKLFLSKVAPRYQLIGLSVALFVLVYGVMITGSRGSILTLFLGFGLIMASMFRHAPRRALGALLAPVLLAYAGAELIWQGDLSTRLGALSSPASAGAERLLIWQQSWELLRQSPWWGIGIGLYPLAWASYRHPEDGSAGFFAHNDYLQIWIETGIPGLLLFVAILAAAAWLFVGIQRSKNLPLGQRAETAGIAAGLAAIALHAFIEFPFYIVPILIVYGLMLARLQSLAAVLRTGSWVVYPARYLSRAGFRAIVVAATLLPLAYFLSVIFSDLYRQQGIALAARGRLDDADEVLIRAMRLRPDSDSVLIARADLHRNIIERNPTLAAQHRAALFESADRLLMRAEQLNPFRPSTYVVHAELYRNSPTLAGERWREKVEGFYQAALERNPRYHPARYLYGRFVLDRGDVLRARQILDGGASYGYAEDPNVVHYLLLTAELRARTGDVRGAEALRKRLAAYQAHHGEAGAFRPETRSLPVPESADPAVESSVTRTAPAEADIDATRKVRSR